MAESMIRHIPVINKSIAFTGVVPTDTTRLNKFEIPSLINGTISSITMLLPGHINLTVTSYQDKGSYIEVNTSGVSESNFGQAYRCVVTYS